MRDEVHYTGVDFSVKRVEETLHTRRALMGFETRLTRDSVLNVDGFGCRMARMTRDEFFRARLVATKLPPGAAKGSRTPVRPVKSGLSTRPKGIIPAAVLEWRSTRGKV